MKANAGFIFLFSAMLLTVWLLHGCTQLDTQDWKANRWHVTVVSNESECRVDIGQDKEHTFDDESLELEQPTGMNK